MLANRVLDLVPGTVAVLDLVPGTVAVGSDASKLEV
jgi:hypothetical protein